MTTGISGKLSTFGEYSDIPSKFQAAIRAGINFFEIRSERPITFNRQIQGPYSVTAAEEYDTVHRQPFFNIDWQTGDRACVRFESTKANSGLAKAFMPDDKFWHNRILICDNPDLQRVQAYHTKDGMFPGSMVIEEINILYKAITVETVEFTIYNALGRPTGSFSSREIALHDMHENGYKNHSVRERTIRVKSPAVLEMIKGWREHRSKFGWTDCPEFVVIQKNVKEQIEELRKGSPVIHAGAGALDSEQLNAAIVSAIRRMPVEERKKLLEDTTKDQVQENVFAGSKPTSLTTGELKELAKTHGVKISGKSTRKTIIASLRKKGLEITDEQAEEKQEAFKNAPVQSAQEPQEEEVVR